MTTLDNRPNTALLVIDAQSGVVIDGSHDRDGVIATIGSLVDRARSHDVPVVWVQHSDEGMAIGSEPWQIVPELSPGESEVVVHKTFGDSFEATDLESVLAANGVGHVVVTGAQTDMCVRSTLAGAVARGYDATLVSDAHTTEDLSEYGAPTPDLVVAHTNLYWSWASVPGREAKVVESAELQF